MYNPPFEDRPASDALAVGPLRVLSHPSCELGPKPAVCYRRIDFPVAASNQGHIGRAEPRRSLNKGGKHLLQIEGRAADDLQHITRRSLVLERFFKIAGALAQLAKKPRILHRNDSLRREVLQERDLLVGEGADLLTNSYDYAEQHIVF